MPTPIEQAAAAWQGQRYRGPALDLQRIGPRPETVWSRPTLPIAMAALVLLAIIWPLANFEIAPQPGTGESPTQNPTPYFTLGQTRDSVSFGRRWQAPRRPVADFYRIPPQPSRPTTALRPTFVPRPLPWPTAQSDDLSADPRQQVAV